MDDELMFQNQILAKVIAQMPGASTFQRPQRDQRDMESEETRMLEMESLVSEHEELRRIEVFSSTYNDYAKKTLEQYTLDDFQSL